MNYFSPMPLLIILITALLTACAHQDRVLGECKPGDQLCPGETEHIVQSFANGTERAQTLAAIGQTSVQNCIDPLFPFPNPLHSHEHTTPTGEVVNIDIYVSRINNLNVCESVKFDTTPLIFINGKLVAKDWQYVHKHRQDFNVTSRWIKKYRTYNKHLTKNSRGPPKRKCSARCAMPSLHSEPIHIRPKS